MVLLLFEIFLTRSVVPNFLSFEVHFCSQILFILKDDAKNVEILRIPRTSSTLKTFRFLFPQVIDHHSSMIKVVADDRNVSMRAMICREAHNNRDLQFVFVNKRFMIKSEIRSMLNELLSKKGFFEGVSKNTDDVSHPQPQQQRRQKSTLSKVQPKNAIFVLNICCRPDEYRITFLPDKRQVDFEDRMKIKHCLIKLVDTFWKRGLFGDSSVPQTTAVALPEKPKSTFMPRLLFEKMNKIRTIRGAPAHRKVAAVKVGLNEEEASGSNMAEISRPNATDEATSSHGAFEGLHGTTSPNHLALGMPHQNTASSPTILEQSKPLDSRQVCLEKFGQTKRSAENEKAIDCGVESTHQPVPTSTLCTPSCIPPPGKPILSTVGLLNRQNLRHEVVIVSEKSISSILNTSKIYEKLQSVSVKAREIEVSGCNSKSLFTLNATHNEECAPSCCIQTNSNIRLYDVKRKFHLRKTKTSSRACKLEGLRKIKLKEKNGQVGVNFPKRKKLEQTSKKAVILRKSILQIDNSLYEPKIQSSQCTLNPKLTSQAYSQKIVFNLWNQSKECSDLPPQVAPLNPVKRTQISKTSLTFEDRGKNGGLVMKQKQNKIVPKLNLETVSRTNQSDIGKPIPAVADFIYAPNLKMSKNFEISKNTLQTLHSEFNMMSRRISLGSPEIFTTKKEISQNIWSTSKMVPYDENCFSGEFAVGKNWFSGAPLNMYPALKHQEKSMTGRSCKVPQCICSCHKMSKSLTNSSTCPATVVFANSQNKSANVNNLFAPVIQTSPVLFSKSSAKDQTSVEYFPNNFPCMIPISTNDNAVCGSNAEKTHSLGIFSELAELYSVARQAEASRCLGALISRPPAEGIDGVQNEAEVQPVFSESYYEKLPNRVAHDSYSLLTQSMNRCSVKGNSAEVLSNHFNTFCSKTGKDFRLTFTPKRISPHCGEKNSDILSPGGPGPDDTTQMANNSFDLDEDNFSISTIPGPYDPTQLHLADDSFSVNLEDSSTDIPQAYTLSQLANDSFCVNLENSWVGNTPGARFFTRFPRDSFSMEAEKAELGKPNPIGARDFSQFAVNSFSKDLENSKLNRSDPDGTNDLSQFTSDSFSSDLENSGIKNIEANNATELSNDSFFMDLENSTVSNAFGADDPTQLANNSYSLDQENVKIDNTVRADDPTQLINDSVGTDLTSCSTIDPTVCANAKESNQSEINERICHENDLLIEKMLYRRNSKFLGAASVFDIPKGILAVQGTKSKPISLEKRQKIDFNKFAKPCSMKNHLTFGKDWIGRLFYYLGLFVS